MLEMTVEKKEKELWKAWARLESLFEAGIVTEEEHLQREFEIITELTSLVHPEP